MPELEIWEHPPSMLRNIDGGPLRGVGLGDLRAPTINIKNVDGRHPGPYRKEGGGFSSHPGSKRCVVSLHSHDRQKVILLTCLILLAPSSVMADDP
jgi:hypothetical protein